MDPTFTHSAALDVDLDAAEAEARVQAATEFPVALDVDPTFPQSAALDVDPTFPQAAAVDPSP